LIFEFNYFSVKVFPTKKEYLEAVEKFIKEHEDDFIKFKEQKVIA